MDYYDAILVGVPMTFAGVAGAGTLSGASTYASVTAAGLCTIALIFHAMFVNGPVPSNDNQPTPPPTSESGTVSGPISAD